MLALALASVTVILHAVGTVKIVFPPNGILQVTVAFPGIVSSGLDADSSCESAPSFASGGMTIWAAGFATFGLFSDFETSLYYSMKSFTTVGYGDILPESKFRLLGPIEAAVGILMLGWSTSIIVAAVQRIYNPRSEPSNKS